MLREQGGFTIVGIAVTLAVVAASGVAALSFSSLMQKTAKSAASAGDYRALSDAIYINLSSNASCREFFNQTLPSGTVVTAGDVPLARVIAGGKTLNVTSPLTPNAVSAGDFGGLIVTGATLRAANPGATTRTLEVDVAKSDDNVFGGRRKKQLTFKLAMSLSGGQVTCKADWSTLETTNNGTSIANLICGPGEVLVATGTAQMACKKFVCGSPGANNPQNPSLPNFNLGTGTYDFDATGIQCTDYSKRIYPPPPATADQALPSANPGTGNFYNCSVTCVDPLGAQPAVTIALANDLLDPAKCTTNYFGITNPNCQTLPPTAPNGVVP